MNADKFTAAIVMIGLLVLTTSTTSTVFAQEEDRVTREIQLGALITSGNTEEESLNFAASMTINPENPWVYTFSLDGLYNTSDNEVKGQRWYAVGNTNYEFSEASYFQSRVSHEDDRFSGFDSQSDLTFSYGREFLQSRANMGLAVDAGIGIRWSRLDGSDNDEPIFRLAGDYNWALSDSAEFQQEIATEFGSDSSIYRSESSIETRILENLSLRFSIRIKHQTEVPAGRDGTDTETAVTFVMSF